MLTLAALLAVVYPGPQSTAVRQLFRDACVAGELRLTPEQGTVVKWETLPETIRWLRIGNQRRDLTTYIKMSSPPSTYVLITRYPERADGFAPSQCIVASRVMTFEDAAQQLYEGTPDAYAMPSSYGGQLWEIDMPDQGYIKYLFRTSYDFLVLQTNVYGQPKVDAAAKK
ncbi:hypothetical protein [Allosphingosinicella indica]|uniref:Uncharacterized protein n=1 Tax=Allosphingosinicella indica TaxID=941907 RepID=A0A1X7G3Y2_9SPHN|nr:hypothetical protein [Allosphingosinicella indica]SMF62800.1 hypothetical protein SAMN06295910_1020 [Allosphingosinicella indica]